MTPISRELLAPSLDRFGRSLTLPAAAYTDWSVFRWEQKHFFDEAWVEWNGWSFVNAGGDAPPFEDHVGNLGDLLRNYDCTDLVVGARPDYVMTHRLVPLAPNRTAVECK